MTATGSEGSPALWGPGVAAKRPGLDSIADERGVIHALAMDQRGSLRKALAEARGVAPDAVPDETLAEFKTSVTRVLSPHVSAVLLDPEFGLHAARQRHACAGLVLAYELSGYDCSRPGRLPDLLPDVSARRMSHWGADAVKLLVYYSPDDPPGINERKHALVERVGAECQACALPFVLELLTYDAASRDDGGVEYARRRPSLVRRAMEEFSKRVYAVDLLKVEIPVDLRYVEGSGVFAGTSVYSRPEAVSSFRALSDVTSLPYTFLSGGVSTPQFVEALQLANEAGGYAGILCGRATWKGGIQVYAREGRAALEDWLAVEGVGNLHALNVALAHASPWRPARGAHYR